MTESVKVIAEQFDGNWVADAAKIVRQRGDREAWLVFAPHDADPMAALEAENARLREARPEPYCVICATALNPPEAP